MKAQFAGTAAIANRPIVSERQIQKQFSQKKLRAPAGRNEVRIFTDPAEPGDTGEVSLHNGTRIDEGFAAHITNMELSNTPEQPLQPTRHQVVIVATPIAAPDPPKGPP